MNRRVKRHWGVIGWQLPLLLLPCLLLLALGAVSLVGMCPTMIADRAQRHLSAAIERIIRDWPDMITRLPEASP